jgi:hypothetical protein
LGRLEEALSRQMALKQEYDAVEGGDGYVFEEIGECLLALARDVDAPPYFRKAYDLLSQDTWLSANEPERLARLKNLAEHSR